jgi:hypothetical protein
LGSSLKAITLRPRWGKGWGVVAGCGSAGCGR